MSSTNRANAQDRHIADYYVTPVQDIVAFLGALDNVVTLDLFADDNYILDPCAGGDATHKMSYPEAIREYYKYDGLIATVDIRKDSLASYKRDYLQMVTPDEAHKPYLVISNPPFNQAIEFIKKALEDVKDGGYVIMLLRLNFLEGKVRKSFFEKYMPKYIFVHHKRMCFKDGGGTDSVAYAHYVWKKGDYPEFAEIRII